MKPSKDSRQKSLSRMLRFAPSQSRKIVMLMFMYFIIAYTEAQVIWGTTSGYTKGSGSIFKVNPDGSAFEKFELPGGGDNNLAHPWVEPHHYRLVKCSNGKFYGITLGGGEIGEGTLFAYDPANDKIEVKVHFYFYNVEGRPVGNLLEYNGKLYGTTSALASSLFSFDLATDEFAIETTFKSFVGELTLVNGKLYGMTKKDGATWAGTIFEYDPQTSVKTTLFEFDQLLTGKFPTGSLTYLNGKLYGLTTQGGAFTQGTLFAYDLATQVYQKKVDFKFYTNGSGPIGDLTLYNGKLLGVTDGGGNYKKGVLFEFDPTTDVLVKLIDLNSESQGKFFRNFNGKLYGVTTTGGAAGKGTLFTLDPVARQYYTLKEFTATEVGINPFGTLVMDGDVLWGMTRYGASGNGGSIFSYHLNTGSLYHRQSFNYFPYGKRPTSLIEHDGKIYGLAAEGGDFGKGTLFEFNPTTHDFITWHSFSCDENECGASYEEKPQGNLVVVGNVLYGFTWKGGNGQAGELFKYDLTMHRYTQLYKFNTPAKGIAPWGNLEVLYGKIYGSTVLGGTNNMGVVFEYDINSSMVDVTYSLNASSGTQVQFTAINNLLPGLATGGIYGSGVINWYYLSAGQLGAAYYFNDASQGAFPVGKMVQGGSVLYGVTTSPPGIFEFNPRFSTYTPIYNTSEGGFANGVLAFGDNKLYGATGYGTELFQFDISTREFITLPFQPITRFNEGEINSIMIRKGVNCEQKSMLVDVVSYSPGNRKDGTAISAERTDPEMSLYLADTYDSPNSDNKFTSLGFGGSITLAFDYVVCDRPGNDFRVYETSYGNPSFYHNPEQAEVFVSIDNYKWYSLGRTSPINPLTDCSAKMDTDFDISVSGLPWIKYVMVVDVTNPMAKRRGETTCLENGPYAFNAAADGFDLDAIEPISLDANTNVRKSPALASHTVDIDGSKTKAVLYPNPVPDELTIDLSQEEEIVMTDENIMFEIMDINGKIVHKSVKPWDDTWMIKHNVRELKSGMYIARVKNGTVRRSYKFLKN